VRVDGQRGIERHQGALGVTQERQRQAAELMGVGVGVPALDQLVHQVERPVIILQGKALASPREQPVSRLFLHRPS
jgi:hypothetical protein